MRDNKANFLFISKVDFPNRSNYVTMLHTHDTCTLLQTVSENARLDVNSPGGDDDFELWDQSGFMLRTDVDDPLTNAKYVSCFFISHKD